MNHGEENTASTYQSLYKINDIFTPPKLLNPGLNLRNSINNKIRLND